MKSSNISRRNKINRVLKIVFSLSTVLAVVTLAILLVNILNGAFGYVIVETAYSVEELTGGQAGFDTLDEEQLRQILDARVRSGILRRLKHEKDMEERSRHDLLQLIDEYVIRPEVKNSWDLGFSLLRKAEINRVFHEYKAEHPNSYMEFRAWITPKFLVKAQSARPEKSGIRTAILGSLGIILITILFAFPLGVAAAVYLEEYAADTRLNRIIQVNIYNLSGVPSIIYGLLGLAVFVRFMKPLTSGAFLGVHDTNGRTILSAGLTLSLLILPIIIINAQEAIRAVPQSLRQAGYGLGATKWQTIRHHVLPASFDRILTGTIIAVSRALGETAPLVVVGAATFLSVDPKSPFDKFTALPIQIYQWSARPQPEFRNAAAAAIIVLLILLLSLNTAAIIARQKISKQRRMM